jgi:hypothetical protein
VHRARHHRCRVLRPVAANDPLAREQVKLARFAKQGRESPALVTDTCKRLRSAAPPAWGAL